MHYYLEFVAKILSHNIFVHIYSSPNFVMEIGISLLMCFIHCLLIKEVNAVIKAINVPPLKIRVKESLEDIHSRASVYKGVVRNHPDLGVDIVFKDNNFLKDEWDTTTKINKILSTSLSEYIRRDMKKMKSRLPIEGGDDELNVSTNKLDPQMDGNIYKYVLQESDIQRYVNSDGTTKVERTEILRLQ